MNSDLNRGYAYPPYEGEDDDLVVEARTRSERVSGWRSSVADHVSVVFCPNADAECAFPYHLQSVDARVPVCLLIEVTK